MKRTFARDLLVRHISDKKKIKDAAIGEKQPKKEVL
jgi:hypothetical protein